jgi:hypothetical protein
MKTDLPARMRAAADTLEEVSALYGYRNTGGINWSAEMLRREAPHVESEIPE